MKIQKILFLMVLSLMFSLFVLLGQKYHFLTEEMLYFYLLIPLFFLLCGYYLGKFFEIKGFWYPPLLSLVYGSLLHLISAISMDVAYIVFGFLSSLAGVLLGFLVKKMKEIYLVE
ncbi:MAG: hypothetical protein Q4Q07_00085 [Tissierellia bacterium]|nr:hypothetical protein [Tissierellia bacterium]